MNYRVMILGDMRKSVPIGWMPVQESGKGGIAIEVAREAYEEYVRRYGKEQDLARLAERGGFSWAELVDFLYTRLRIARGRQP